MRKKITTELNSFEEILPEELGLVKFKNYNSAQFLQAVLDLSLFLDNPYFKTPFNRCPSCHKGNNAIMGHFGYGGANKIGNLKGFQATIGDIISWNSSSYNGLSLIKAKNNGIFTLETDHFFTPRKEPAVVERMVVPMKYRPILGDMAMFLANRELYEKVKLVKIGNGEYPNVIAKKL